jgi:hypothetical protein
MTMADVSSRVAAGAFQRRGFLVLGMHRSGTSVAAGVLSLLGITLPATPMPPTPDNPKGYFESRKLQRFHDLVLADLGSSWDDWRSIDAARRLSPGADDIFSRAVELLNSEFLHAHAFVLKDPRVCRMAGLWLDVFAACAVTPLVVMPFRHPSEVAGSLARRDGMAPDQALLIWLRHVLEAERLSRGCRRAALDMDEVMGDWRGAFGRIGAQLGIDWTAAIAAAGDAIDAFVDPGLRRAPRSSEAQAGLLPALAGEVYDAMLALRSDPQDGAAIAALDGIAARLDRLAALIDAPPGAAPPVDEALAAEAARLAGTIAPRPHPAVSDPVARRLALVAAFNADRLAWLTETVEAMARAGAVQQAQIAELAHREPAALQAVAAWRSQAEAAQAELLSLLNGAGASIGQELKRQLAVLDPLFRHAATVEAAVSGLSSGAADMSSALHRVSTALDEQRRGHDALLRESAAHRDALAQDWSRTGDGLRNVIADAGRTQARLLADQGAAIRQAVEDALAAVRSQSAGDERRMEALVARAEALFGEVKRGLDQRDAAATHLAQPWTVVASRLAAAEAEAAGHAAETQALKRERDALAERCAGLEAALAAARADAAVRQGEQETCEAALLDVLERHAALERRYEELERRIGGGEPRSRGGLIRRLTGD